MTSFERDMGQMVHEAAPEPSKASMAMNYVRATGKIANGHRGNVEAICDALIAQTPIILEMYLGKHVSAEEVDKVIKKHLADCPAAKVLGMRKDDVVGGADTKSFNWQRFAFSMAGKLTWPGAATVFFITQQDPLGELIRNLAKAVAG